MDKESLLIEHEDLKRMPFYSHPNQSTFKERAEYYSAFISHVDRVCELICGGKIEENYLIYERDFWWIHNAKKPIRISSYSRTAFDIDMCRFADEYNELLLDCLYRMILGEKVDRAVCADYRSGRFVGYKVYEKRNGQWTGVLYKKYSKVS